MKFINSWSQNYRQGLKNIGNGDVSKAYGCGVECLRIVKELFRNGDLDDQVNSLDKYLKSILLLKSCSEVKNCTGCIEKQYLSGVSTLLSVNNTNSYHYTVRLKAGELLFSLKSEIIDFYLEHDMGYELEVFKSNFKENYKKFILVN